MRRAITQCRNALSVVIRQGQVGMPEHVENRVPVVVQLDRQRLRLGMAMSEMLNAGVAQRRAPRGLRAGQIQRHALGRWIFASGVVGRHEFSKGGQHPLTEASSACVVAFHQPLRLAQPKVRSAALPLRATTIAVVVKEDVA